LIQFDPQLIKRCLKKDRKAQNELFKECYDFMMAICWRYSSSRSEAVEFLNHAFLKALLNLKKYKTEIPFELWLRRLVINDVIDQLRKKKTYTDRIDLREESEMHREVAYEETNDFKEERLAWIRTKAQDLPNVTGKVFQLYAFDGYKHQEIAQMLNISEGTSQWHYSIAKQKLREWSIKKEA